MYFDCEEYFDCELCEEWFAQYHHQRGMTCTCGMSAVDRLRGEAIADWPDWLRSSPPFPPPSPPPPRCLSPPPPPPSSPPPPPPLLCTMALGMGGGRVDIFNISLSLTFYQRSKHSPPKLTHSHTLQIVLYYFTSKCCCTALFHRSFFTFRFVGRSFLAFPGPLMKPSLPSVPKWSAVGKGR